MSSNSPAPQVTSSSSPAQEELESYPVDVSHQEMSRIILELEEFYGTQPETVWIPSEAAEMWLCEHLGYEDRDEFEDAIKGPFAKFIKRLPQFETRPSPSADPSTPEDERPVEFRNRALGEGRPVRMIYKVEKIADLWAVMVKSPTAYVEIPEIEFTIGADSKRCVDSVYNYIANAVYNLGQYAQNAHGKIKEDHFNKILDTITTLNCLLDVPKPFHWVVFDPKGQCAFKPADRVIVDDLDLHTIKEEEDEKEEKRKDAKNNNKKKSKADNSADKENVDATAVTPTTENAD